MFIDHFILISVTNSTEHGLHYSLHLSTNDKLRYEPKVYESKMNFTAFNSSENALVTNVPDLWVFSIEMVHSLLP